MLDTRITPEKLRENLKDVVSLIEGLSSVCETTKELAEVCSLALTNDGQLALVFKSLAAAPETPQQQRKWA